jgi:FG-GAP-like repeat
MKHLSLLLIVSLTLSFALLPPASANHRTGSLILPELIVAGDFNQDGKMDLAVDATGFDNVAILVGDGAGGFTLGGHFATDTLPKGLQVGDVNRDGKLDLVTCNNWGYDETVLLGDGLGAFHSISPPNEVDGDGEPVRFLLRDFNSDGRLDLAVNAPDDSKLILFFGDGEGNFPGPDLEIENVQHPFGMASGDFNQDGNLDMAIGAATRNDSATTVLLGDGKGNFSTNTVPCDHLPSSVQVGDLNNDGKPDFVVAGALPHNDTGNFISTFLGDGTGQFALKQTVNLGQGSSKGETALGDFNEDGNLDVAFPQTGIPKIIGEAIHVLIYFGDGSGGLTVGPILDVGLEPHSVLSVDINGDHHLDLAVSNRSDGTITMLLGDGKGNFTVSSTTSILSPNE